MVMLFILSVYLLLKKSTEVVTFTVKRRANGVTLFQSAKVNFLFFMCVSSPKDHIYLSFIQSSTLIILVSLTFHTEITCIAPVISNGYIVEPRPNYQKDAILKYKCNPGFKERDGIPRCAKFGWTLNPECDGTTILPTIYFS